MRTLTVRQSRFVDNIIMGMTQADAYRKAGYSVDNMDNKAIAHQGHKLANKANICAIIAQRKKELTGKAIWDREKALTMFRDIAIVAMDNIINGESYCAANANTALKAIELANKMCGYNEPERRELDAAVTVELALAEEYAK